MPGETPLSAAMRQLQAALAALEDAVGRREDEQRRRVDLEAELHRVGADRSRLAQSLDAAVAKAGRLEDANREVARRLVATMESIRGVIARGATAGIER